MPKSLREILATNLIRLRREKEWTQEDLADECGLHRTYIGDIERRARNISIDNIGRLATALGVDAWVLVKAQHI